MRRAVGLGLLVLAATPLTLAAQAADSLAQAANTAAAANTVAINFVWTLVAGFIVMVWAALQWWRPGSPAPRTPPTPSR